nr:helical backbone metal receptor [uncultured Nocardioides sp.]
MRDDLGADVPLPVPATRVVSLVPSLTEALAVTAPDRLVGATDWCTHPADLDVARVRGTKNPDLAAIRALSPDLVVANKEENRELDVRRLREAGVAVWVTRIETVEESLDSMSRLLHEALGLSDPAWLVDARALWSAPAAPAAPRLRVSVPIWRDPWMVVGAQTYTDDLLTRAGLTNVLAHGPAAKEGRYPTVTPDDIDGAGADVVLLPDEPYVFTADDGPEALRTPTRLVSGRLLTWYGPAMVEAHAVLAGLAG